MIAGASPRPSATPLPEGQAEKGLVRWAAGFRLRLLSTRVLWRGVPEGRGGFYTPVPKPVPEPVDDVEGVEWYILFSK